MTFNYLDNVFNNRILQYQQAPIKPVEKACQPSKKRKIIGNTIGAGIGLALPVYDIIDTLQKQELSNGGKSFLSKIMPDVDTFENTQKNINALIDKTGLKSKGVELLAYDGSAEVTDKIKSALNVEYKSSNKITRRIKENAFIDIANSENACFLTKTKKIILNKNQTFNSAYHELGHALNTNSTLGKILQKGRILTPLGISIMIPVALGIGLFHKIDTTKPKEEKSKTERTLDFIKNNAGKLTLASYIPLLAEEGLASIKGIKLAKNYLNPAQLSKLKGNYFKAWSSYGAVAALASLGVAVGVEFATNYKKGKNKAV